MLPVTSRALAAIHARGTDTRAPGRPLSTRRTTDTRDFFGLYWHRQCRRGHAPFLSYLLPCRVHDAHRRAVPVVMEGDARTLIALNGHPGLVQMRVLTRGRRRFHSGHFLRMNSVARNYIALRRRGSIL